jgi:DHA3 family macrolide efflux protein-like MFS transporter
MSLVGLAPEWMFWLAVFGFGFAGFMNPLANGPLMAILQATVAPDMQGRVFTLIGSMASLMSPLSLAIAGPVSDLTGVRVWYLVGGILCAIMGLAAGAIPAVLHLEDGPPGTPILAVAEASIAQDPPLPD